MDGIVGNVCITPNMIIFKPTWLYIKQHNITGLKYFGKTTNKNPVHYLGSGKYWTYHLNKHGRDIKTVWCQLFTDKQSLIDYALQFSEEHKIVESDEWANLKIENGIDGGGCPGRCGNKKGFKHTEETKKKISVNSARYGLGTKLSDERRAHIKATWRDCRGFGACSTPEKEHERREKLKLSNKRMKELHWRVVSPGGNVFIIIGLKEFCIQHQLPYQAMKVSGTKGIPVQKGGAIGWFAEKII